MGGPGWTWMEVRKISDHAHFPVEYKVGKSLEEGTKNLCLQAR